ncbi:MAG: phosphoribosylformylglycinamidine synthase subunit PurQ, partial [Chloroflexi bacterium]|nr:phosphoribosylformylglycinamidine synthase subunit PurQ [Chloroflexota bacterium]
FQILCEAALLPGALIRNRDLLFHCEHVFLETVTRDSPFTGRAPKNQSLRIPIAHRDGCFYADEPTLQDMESRGQVLWRYVDRTGAATDAANPNGSVRNIAGVCNERRNVAGLMPHPERACELILGGTDGCCIFESLVSFMRDTRKAAA